MCGGGDCKSNLCGGCEVKQPGCKEEGARVGVTGVGKRKGLLRRWSTGRMSHPVPQRLLGPVSERTADVASIDQSPAQSCGQWD